jgi:hypothetical protein
MTDKTKPIDPRTTRRRVLSSDYFKNSALWSTYNCLGFEGEWAVLQRKTEYCTRKPSRLNQTESTP